MTDRHGKPTQSGSGKRPYHRPKLFVYGDVNKLTRAKMIFSRNPLDGKTKMFGMFTLQWRS